MLVAHGRTTETPTDRRRIRVLVVGTVIGVTAGAGAVIGYWLQAGADIFATRTLAVLSLVFLAVPASFAYAILRHRLFDLRLIVRQGVRYALARRLLDALIPVLGALLLADLVLINRHEPLLATLQSRWWWYTLVGAALILARSRRERWLKTLDRRFFRERYDAQRLLRNLAQQIGTARSFDAVAPSVAQQLDQALHPEFVDVLVHVPVKDAFAPVAATRSTGLRSRCPASLTVIGVLSVLSKPLALSLGDTAWLSTSSRCRSATCWCGRGIELLVPITSQAAAANPAALIALGPRRSEEPYNEEDIDLLATIAHALGLLLDRAPAISIRPDCPSATAAAAASTARSTVCTFDNARLTPARGAAAAERALSAGSPAGARRHGRRVRGHRRSPRAAGRREAHSRRPALPRPI